MLTSDGLVLSMTLGGLQTETSTSATAFAYAEPVCADTEIGKPKVIRRFSWVVPSTNSSLNEPSTSSCKSFICEFNWVCSLKMSAAEGENEPGMVYDGR